MTRRGKKLTQVGLMTCGWLAFLGIPGVTAVVTGESHPSFGLITLSCGVYILCALGAMLIGD